MVASLRRALSGMKVRVVDETWSLFPEWRARSRVKWRTCGQAAIAALTAQPTWLVVGNPRPMVWRFSFANSTMRCLLTSSPSHPRSCGPWLDSGTLPGILINVRPGGERPALDSRATLPRREWHVYLMTAKSSPQRGSSDTLEAFMETPSMLLWGHVYK